MRSVWLKVCICRHHLSISQRPKKRPCLERWSKKHGFTSTLCFTNFPPPTWIDLLPSVSALVALPSFAGLKCQPLQEDCRYSVRVFVQFFPFFAHCNLRKFVHASPFNVTHDHERGRTRNVDDDDGRRLYARGERERWWWRILGPRGGVRHIRSANSSPAQHRVITREYALNIFKQHTSTRFCVL